MLTLIQTAKLNGVDPQAWLADVLARHIDVKPLPSFLPPEFMMRNNQDAKARAEAAHSNEKLSNAATARNPGRNTRPTPVRLPKGPNVCVRCASQRKLSERAAVRSHRVVASHR
jgi:hypothetical protein